MPIDHFSAERAAYTNPVSSNRCDGGMQNDECIQIEGQRDESKKLAIRNRPGNRCVLRSAAPKQAAQIVDR